jgi:hypothetical protein
MYQLDQNLGVAHSGKELVASAYNTESELMHPIK